MTATEDQDPPRSTPEPPNDEPARPESDPESGQERPLDDPKPGPQQRPEGDAKPGQDRPQSGPRPGRERPSGGRRGRGGHRGRPRHYRPLAFSQAGMVHHVPVDPRRFALKHGDLAVVETDRGLSIAKVLAAPTLSDDTEPSRRVRKVVRPAREPDLITHAEGKSREPEILDEIKRITARTRPSMRILSIDHQAIGGKVTVYFASEQRVDFRALVRELAQVLGMRIEMRQVGVRDESKLLGGIGHCGRELCCCTWLCDFAAVSIRMAKDQNLALSPNKISGLCGRLMCCLSYEHAEYACLRKGLPKTGKRVSTNRGPGKVLSVDVLQQRFTLLGDDGVRHTLGSDAIERDDKGLPVRPPPPGGAGGPTGRRNKPPSRGDSGPGQGARGPSRGDTGKGSDDGRRKRGRGGAGRSRRGRSRKPQGAGGKGPSE